MTLHAILGDIIIIIIIIIFSRRGIIFIIIIVIVVIRSTTTVVGIIIIIIKEVRHFSLNVERACGIFGVKAEAKVEGFATLSDLGFKFFGSG